MLLRLTLIAGLLLAAATACNGRLGRRSSVPEYLVHVNALRDHTAPQQGSYVVLPGVDGVEPLDLQFREYAEQVHRVMASKGYTRASAARDGQLAIFVGYGLGQPRVSYESVSHPGFGLTPAEPAPLPASDGGVADAPAPNADGLARVAPPPTEAPPPAQATTTTDRTTVRKTGYNSWTVESDRQYERFLQLSAVDVKRYLTTGEVHEVWRVTVTSTGTTGDLRMVMPVLVAAARNAIATDSGQARSIWIKDNDPRVEYVRSGGVAPTH
ncbi:MAG: hypothetical protein OXT09_10795 [Myxococcales bacterium]|nr:hypothetical protein [Myxococcales bacterium]